MGIPIQGIFHDMSKFSPAEFIPSAKYFQGNRSPIEAEAEAVGYSYAWRHHKGCNKHHWQWYVDFNKDKSLNPAPMPLKYVKELVCDLKGAAKAYGGSNAEEYFKTHFREWIIHEETERRIVECFGISWSWWVVNNGAF